MLDNHIIMAHSDNKSELSEAPTTLYNSLGLGLATMEEGAAEALEC